MFKQITLFITIILLSLECVSAQDVQSIKQSESVRVVILAQKYINDTPVTVTAFAPKNSAGGLHDYYSDSDYWWPDSMNPGGPYIRWDGHSNPANFVAHRHALIDMSVKVAALTAAYTVSKNKTFSRAAIHHLLAWFVTESTRMNPHLSFAQAVKGRTKGRGVGIIDTIHLLEVARSVELLYKTGMLQAEDYKKIVAWFEAYLQWMFTHPNGIEEQNAKNNHGTCYTMQVAGFAHLTNNDTLLIWCKNRLENILIPNQMAKDGSFPLELERTKPYSYSIFNLDAMVMIAQILSDRFPEIWRFKDSSGKVIRNFPVRQPLLWLN
ncbi:MAG: alginate lyase family protein [Ignavibacteriales bacterium]|nr:alginate lyase family protein [Ignavibacteriales bacterium]